MSCIVHRILQDRILEWVPFSFSRGSSQPGIEPRSPASQVDSLPAEPQGEAHIYTYIHVIHTNTYTHIRTCNTHIYTYTYICIYKIDSLYFILWLYNNYVTAAAAAAKSLQSCLTLCDPRDGSSPGTPVPGILQARTLEWVAISFSNAWKWKWSRSVVSDSQRPHGLQPTRLLRPWDSPGKRTGVGCHR